MMGKKNKLTDSLSWLTMTGNKNPTHESKYIIENTSNKYEINKIPEGIFLLHFKTIWYYRYK